MSVKKTKPAKKRLSSAPKASSLTAKKTVSRTASSLSISKGTLKVSVKTTSVKSSKTANKKSTKQAAQKPSLKAKGAQSKGITVASVAPIGKSTKPGKLSLSPVVKVIEAKSVLVKEEVYKVGDKVVYPAHGVGLIDSIQSRIVGTQETKFYMITILETAMKVMVPMKQASTVGLRRIVDTKTVEKVYEILRDKDVIVHQQTWNRRHREYTQKLKTGSVFEIASVIRDLSVLKGDKELSFGERKMLDMAQGLLVKEISIAKSKTEDLIKAELQEICDAA